MITRKMMAGFVLILMLSISAYSQNIGIGINADGSAPAGSAVLDVSSTTKGFLLPRMTYAQKMAIASPFAGLMVYCTNCGTAGELQVYNGTTWTNVIGGAATAGKPDAPTIGTATAGNAQATVTFTQPASNGGFTISAYTATSTPGGKTGTLNQAGGGTITVTGLTNGTAYTFTITATTVSGTGPASAASNSVTPVSPVVGGSYQGGIIFYIFISGDPGYVAGQTHGLIAALSDQSMSDTWYNTVNTTTGATGTALGTGSSNTTAIIASQGNTGIYAAKLCRDYAGGGYNDWYLPSKDELKKLYLNRVTVGGFTYRDYWSSSEEANASAWMVSFTNSNPWNYSKGFPASVRAVRAF